MPLEGPLDDHVDASRPRLLVQPVLLPTKPAQKFPVLRCSALELSDLPVQARQIVVGSPLNSVEARQLVRDANARVTVASRGTTLIAFGSDEELERVFKPAGGEVRGTVELDPAEDSTDLGLIYDALTRALTRGRPLRPMFRSGGHRVLVRPPDQSRNDRGAQLGRNELAALHQAYGVPLTGTVQKIDRPFAEGIHVRLEHWDGRWWFVYDPFTWVHLPRPPEEGSEGESRGQGRNASLPRTVASDWGRERWAQRYNPRWNEIIDAWAKLLAPTAITQVTAHRVDGDGVNAAFQIANVTAWCSPGRFRQGTSP